jgi:hypothetical protein
MLSPKFFINTWQVIDTIIIALIMLNIKILYLNIYFFIFLINNNYILLYNVLSNNEKKQF